MLELKNKKKAVIISSNYAHQERIDLLKEGYEKQGYVTEILLTDFIHSSKTYAKEAKDGYILVKTKPYKKNISVQRMYSHHCFAQDIFHQLEKMNVDLLHVMIPANSLTRVARKYKEKHPEVKLYLDIIDLWPETMPINHFKTTYPFRKWRDLRDKNLWNADLIYCECYLFKQVLKKELDDKYKVLYWTKTSESIQSFPKLKDDELHLCYLGSINNIIDIDYIIKMCEALSQITKLVIHIVGRGEKKDELLERLKNVNVRVIYHGVIYDSIKKQEIFDQCHFGLNIMKSTVCVGLTMKSLDYFQAGLPIINNIHGDTSELVKDYKIGFNHYNELMEKFSDLKHEDYMALRENVKKLYNEKFTKDAFFKSMDIRETIDE